MLPKVFQTIKTQLLVIFFLFTLITIVISLYCFQIYGERERSSDFRNKIHDVFSNVLFLNELQFQFLTYDSKNNIFYQAKHSEYIKKHDSLFGSINQDLDSLQGIETNNKVLQNDIGELKNQLLKYKGDFESLVFKIHKRGFRDYGLEGRMRNFIHNVELYKNSINMELLLTIRRNEKDYLLRKDSTYIIKHGQNIELLKSQITGNLKLSAISKNDLLNSIDQYQYYFNQWIQIDKEIGVDQRSGLMEQLRKHNEGCESIIKKVAANTEKFDKELSYRSKIIFIAAAGFSVFLSILLSFIFSSLFTKPIRKLSYSITEIVENNFSTSKITIDSHHRNEIGTLIKNFKWMNDQIHSYINKIKLNEKTLDAKERKFRALIENCNDAIALTDIKGRITYVSPSTERVIGYTPEELLGKTTAELVHPDDAENLINKFSEVITYPETSIFIQFRIRHKDGSWRWIDGYSNNLLHESSVLGIITNYRDVTSRRNSELKIEEQYKELQKINSELDRFVYSASHDLKAPLTSILGMVHVARLEPEDSCKLRYLEMAEGNVKQLLNVIKDLTNFSRNARLDVMDEKIDFSKIIHDSINSYSHLINFNKIDFKVQIEEDQTFYSDIVRLRILLNNIISNSIIYHRISQDYPFIEISVAAFSSYAKIKIKDNGQGIDPKFHTKIFDMFYRASEDSMGSGLGLYIVKGILEKLNGKITLNSETGIGAEFIITIPNGNDLTRKNQELTHEILINI